MAIPKGFNICYSDKIFSDVAEILRHGLSELGYDAVAHFMAVVPEYQNIFLGVHLIPNFHEIPANSVIFNLEQLGSSSAIVNHPAYFEILRRNFIWDYSQKNIIYLKNMGIDAELVRIGYAPSLSRIMKPERQDIDVLFYGAINPRRNKILRELQERGLRVFSLVGVYGGELDNYISRSKVILNIHFYSTNIFEIVRACYPLHNRKAIVSEVLNDTEIESDVRSSILCSSYEGLIDACHRLVAVDDERMEIEQRGFDFFKNRSQADFLKSAVGKLPFSHLMPNRSVPT